VDTEVDKHSLQLFIYFTEKVQISLTVSGYWSR